MVQQIGELTLTAVIEHRSADAKRLGKGRHRAALKYRDDESANKRNLVTDQTLERMLGYKTIAASVAGPEIAHDVVGQIG